jgi:hypothetical protein
MCANKIGDVYGMGGIFTCLLIEGLKYNRSLSFINAPNV